MKPKDKITKYLLFFLSYLMIALLVHSTAIETVYSVLYNFIDNNEAAVIFSFILVNTCIITLLFLINKTIKEKIVIPEYKPHFSPASPFQRVEEKLEKKCDQVRFINNVILFLIAVSAAAGMYIFVNTEGLAKGDTAYEEAYKRIDVLALNVKENKIAIDNNFSALKEKAEQQQQAPSQLQQSQGQGQLTQAQKMSSYDERISDINKRISYIKSTNEEFQISQESIIKALKEAEAAKAGPLVFISTISNKIGSILILYFFISLSRFW